jgi:hypothetical protein
MGIGIPKKNKSIERMLVLLNLMVEYHHDSLDESQVALTTAVYRC